MILASLPPSAAPNPWSEALRGLSTGEVLFPLLVVLTIVIVAARLAAGLFRRLGQPGVVGEIAVGLVLGPSVFGRFFPEAFQAIFHPTSPGVPAELFDGLQNWVLTTLSQLGLIFLLFLIGLEFDFGHLRGQGKGAVSISVAGIAAPFLIGIGLAGVLAPRVGRQIEPLGFALFLGTALSITAIPILGRMMMELNITRTRLGTVIITAAAVDDAIGWILLAAVAAVVRARFDTASLALMVGGTVAFVLVMFLVVRPLLGRWVRSRLREGDGDLSLNGFAALLAVLFLCAAATEWIGIFSIFGAFCLGAVLSGEPGCREAVSGRLKYVVDAFFLPIFFTYTGLRTDIGSLGSWELWGLCGLVTAGAVAGKFAGCGVAAWLSGFSPRESACVGVMMNTRALMALIVINLGKDLGVLPESVFCMLVVMALVTTVMTTPLLLKFMRGTELEPYITSSGFLGSRKGSGLGESERPG